MFWFDPAKEKKDVKDAKVITIKPGSTLDAPKGIVANSRDFENKLEEHFTKQIPDVELITALFAIYDVYRKEGAVVINSTLNKLLKRRHEGVIVDLIKDNAQHLQHLVGYIR